AGLYFSRLEEGQVEAREDLATIPADATLVLSFRNDSSVDDLFKDYEGFEMILGKAEFAALGNLRDAFLNRPDLKILLADQPVYVSFHPDAGTIAWLLSVPLKEEIDPNQVAAAMQSGINLVPLDTSKGLYELTVPEVDRRMFGNL